MLRTCIFIAFSLTPGAALAHVGHVGELAGHDHWIAIAAVGVAAAVWAAGKLKGEAAETEADDEAQAESAEPTRAEG